MRKLKKIKSEKKKAFTSPDCSFCKRSTTGRIGVIAGPNNIYICHRCVFLSVDILATEFDLVRKPKGVPQ